MAFSFGPSGVDIDEDTMRAIVLGIDFGIAHGWETVEDFTIIFYDYEPNEFAYRFFKNLPKEGHFNLEVNFEKGWFRLVSEIGNTPQPKTGPKPIIYPLIVDWAQIGVVSPPADAY